MLGLLSCAPVICREKNMPQEAVMPEVVGTRGEAQMVTAWGRYADPGWRKFMLAVVSHGGLEWLLHSILYQGLTNTLSN